MGHEITKTEKREVETKEEEWGDVIDYAIYGLFTQKHGETMTIDFRVEHNGYYGGWANLVTHGVDLDEDVTWKALA